MAEVNWLLDTSILVDVLRGYKPAQMWIDSLLPETRYVAVVTAAELLAGCRNQKEQRLVERELALYEMIWLDEKISRSALEFYRRYHLSQNVGFFDCLIAVTATSNALRLATLNLRHFVPFTELEAEKPY